MPRARICFSIFPRYAGGSPGHMLSQTEAERLREEEQDFWAFAKEGVYGEEMQRTAEEEGIEGIVLQTTYKASKVEYMDFITGKQYQDNIPDKCFRHPKRTLIVRQVGNKNEVWFERELIATAKSRDGQMGLAGATQKALMSRGMSREEFWKVWPDVIGA